MYKVALAGFAILLTSTAAMAQSAPTPIKKEFEQICLSMTSLSDATTKARAAGFVTAPPGLRESMGADFPRDGVALLRVEEGRMMLFIGATVDDSSGTMFETQMTAQLCSLAISPTQPGLESKLEQLLGVGPMQTVGDDRSFVYKQTVQGRERLASDRATIDASARAGTLRMAKAQEREEMSTLMLAVPRPSKK